MSALEFRSWREQIRKETQAEPGQVERTPANDPDVETAPTATSPYLRPAPRPGRGGTPLQALPETLVAQARRVPLGVVAGLTIAGLAVLGLLGYFAAPWLRAIMGRGDVREVLTAAGVVSREVARGAVTPLPAAYANLPRGPRSIGVTYFAGVSSRGDDAHLADILSRRTVLRLREGRTGDGGDDPVPVQFVSPESRIPVVFAVTGSVGRVGDLVRAQVRITAADGTPIWRGQLERPLLELDALGRDVATYIAARLAIRLPAGRQSALRDSQASGASLGPDSAEAYDRLLRGRYLRGRYDEASLDDAAAAYERAAELEPGRVAAHAELAATYARLVRWNGPHDEYFARGRAAAATALALDSTSSLAWAARAALAAQAGQADAKRSVGQWVGRALEGGSRTTSVEQMVVIAHLHAGDRAAAEAALRRILRREPDNGEALVELAGLSLRSVGSPRVREMLDRAIAADPKAIPAYALRALTRFRAGDVRSAFADAEVSTQLGRPLWGEAVRVQLQLAAGDKNGAREAALELRRRAAETRLSAWDERFLEPVVEAGRAGRLGRL